MSNLDLDKLNAAKEELEACIATANLSELLDIDNLLDDLKDIVEDNVSALAGNGGDY